MALAAIASAQTLPELLGRRDSSRYDQFRSGDFSGLRGLVIIDPSCDCPFPNNVIPRSRLLPNGAWPEDIFRANQEEFAGFRQREVLEVAQGYTPLISALDGTGDFSPASLTEHPRGHLNPGMLEWLLDGLTQAEVNGRLVNTEGSFRRGQAGWTALHYAARGRGPGIVQLLLDSGASVNARADDGRTPLHFAALSSQQEIVQLLLDSGASVDARDDRGQTPLLLARSLESFQALQAAGADVRAQADSGFTVLFAAALSADAATVEALIGTGLDPNAEASGGWTPLLYARSPETFETLRKAGADIHGQTDRGYTVLHAAASRADAATVEALIASGLDPNAGTSSGWTPLLYAGSRETFEALLAGGADLGPIAAAFAPDGLEAVRQREIAGSVLSRAVRQVGRFASASLVARLRAINPNFAEVPSSTARSHSYSLHYAAEFNDEPAMIAALSTTNVDVTTEGRNGPPLALAAFYNGNPAVIEAVIEAFSATEASSSISRQSFVDRGLGIGPSPLHLAAASSSPRAAEIVGVLLGAGATVNGQYGRNPLYAAAMAQNLAAMELLIAAGGDVNEAFAGEYSASVLATVLERGRFDCGYAPVAAALRAAGAESVWWDRSPAGTDPDGTNRYTNTPHLYVPGPQVVECETVSADVQALIDSGADLDAQDSQGFAALHRAAADSKAVDITALARAGANVNAATRGGRLTPLHVAVWRRAGLATVKALITVGTDVDAVDWFGQTALHRAARDRRTAPAVVAALLAAGADANAKDTHRRTPLHYATRADVNNEAVAELLRTAGGTCRSCGVP